VSADVECYLAKLFDEEKRLDEVAIRALKGGCMKKSLLVLVMLLIAVPAFAEEQSWVKDYRQRDAERDERLKEVQSSGWKNNPNTVQVQIVDPNGRPVDNRKCQSSIDGN